MDSGLRDLNNFEELDVETQWKSLKKLIYNIAEKLCDKPKLKHQDWFDETDGQLVVLLE